MNERERVLAVYDAMDRRRKQEYLAWGEAMAKAHPEPRPVATLSALRLVASDPGKKHLR